MPAEAVELHPEQGRADCREEPVILNSVRMWDIRNDDVDGRGLGSDGRERILLQLSTFAVLVGDAEAVGRGAQRRLVQRETD